MEVRIAVADPTDTVAEVGAVVGGSVYGVFWAPIPVAGTSREGLLFGLPVALPSASSAAVVSTAIGTGLGLVSGYKGGQIDLVIQRTADIVNNVPLLPLLIFMVFVLGSQLWLIMLVLVAFCWPGLTIPIRSMILGLEAARRWRRRARSAPRTRHIILRHILPHTAPFVVTQLIFSVPAAILAEAGLSFLGLGDPSLPTWGQVLENGYRTGAVYLGYWWWVGAPGLLIILTAVTFMLLSLALEPIVNPRLRRSDDPAVGRGAGRGVRTSAGPVRAVDGVSFAIEGPGEALGIIGESGSGKSSLANALMRLLPRNAPMAGGRVRLDGRDVSALPDETFRREVRWKGIAMVFQGAQHALNPVIRVGDQVGRAVALRRHGHGRRTARVAGLLDRVGLPAGHRRSLPARAVGRS